MVNPTNANIAREAETSTKTDGFPVFDQPALPRSRKSVNERSNVDDVIMSLSDSYENRRARQVVEWVRLQGVRREN
ncbi:MAG: hypothetical protein QUS14_09595 [Pyrinomonadaceae bacterium]|nr:hypothetical protein [Pyrinomonadaceae bacterium]